MRACFLGDSGAERRSIACYATERQAGSGKKEAALYKKFLFTYYRLNLNTYL